MTRSQTVALVLGLVVIFAVALVAGVGSEGDTPPEARAGSSAGSQGLRTAAITVVLGFIVFVLGQLAQRLFIEPIQEQKRVIGKVTHTLIYYRNVSDDNPGRSAASRLAEARELYRDLAAELRMNLRVLPLYRFFSRLRLVLPEERVRRAATALIGLSNTVQKGPGADDVSRYRYEVERNLEIER